MSYTYRHLIKRFFLTVLFLIPSSIILGQSFLDDVKKYLQSQEGIHAEFHITQILNDESSRQDGILELLDPEHFIYYTDEAIIRVSEESVFTYSPRHQHVIIDTYYPDEFNALTILTGDFSKIEIGDVEENFQTTSIHFILSNTPYIGTILFENSTFKPKSLKLDMDDIGSLDIIITAFEEINKSVLIEKYTMPQEGWEVLDLRE